MAAPSNRKRVSRHACEPLERRRLLAAVSWDGGGDGANWNDPLNWSNDQLPTPADDVTLAVGSLIQLLDNQGNPEIKSLTTSVPLQLSVQTLTVDGDVTLGANVMMQKSSLIVDGNLTINDNATLFLNQGYSNPASTLAFLGDTDRTISGNGTVDSGADDCTSYINNSTLDPATNTPMNLTLESGISLIGGDFQMSGTNSGGTITNDGTITAGFFTIGNADSTFINNGSITITDNYSTIYNLQNGVGASVLDSTGALYLEGDWHNDGLISVDNASLLLDGNFKLSDLETPGGGTFSRSTVDPNFVYLGGTLDNTNSTLTLDDTLGDWFLAGGGTVLGGTVNTIAGHTLIGANGTLDGVTLNGPMTVDESNTVYIQDNLTLNSTITLGNDTDGSSGQLYFTGPNSESVNGIGQIAVQGEGTGYITNATSAPEANTPLVLTFGNGITITGKRMIMQGGPIVNQGVITAAGDGGSWSLGDSSTFENSGSISASDSVYMQINDLLNDVGRTVSANSNATLALVGDNWHNDGTLSSDNATMDLEGSFYFTDLGNFDRSQVNPGTVNLGGILYNTALTLTLDDATGDWNMIDGADIIGGTVDATVGHQLIGRGGELDGVTLNVPIPIDEYATVYVTDGLTLNSTMTLGNSTDDSNGQLDFVGSAPQILSGTGQILLPGNNYSDITNSIFDSGGDVDINSVTIGSGITISGKYLIMHGGPIVNESDLSLSVDGGNWILGEALSFENAGTISVSANNATMQLNNLVNDDGHIVSVDNGGTLTLQGTWQNLGTLSLANGTLNLAGAFQFSDVGTLDRSMVNPGSVNIAGTLDNSNSTLTLNDTTGDWNLASGGTILGGIVNATAGHQLNGTNGTLDGVVVNAPMAIAGNNSVTVLDGLTLNSTLTLGAADDSYGMLFFGGPSDESLLGTGTITSVGNNSGYVVNGTADPVTSVGQQVTIGPDITIAGKNFQISAGLGGPIVNNGAMQDTTDGGNWTIRGPFTNAGQITIGKGSLLVFANSLNNSGTIDLSGAMIIDYTDASPIDSIRSQLLTGFAAGAWNGDGIDSSFAATHRTMGIGFAEAFDLNVNTFAGQSVGPDSLLLLCTHAGDANLDGLVNIADFNQLAAHFNSASQRWSDADFNYDGKINLLDLNAVATNFGQPPRSRPTSRCTHPLRSIPRANPLQQNPHPHRRPLPQRPRQSVAATPASSIHSCPLARCSVSFAEIARWKGSGEGSAQSITRIDKSF